MDRVIFAPDLIEYAFVGVSLSDSKVMGGKYLNESAFAPLFDAQKKHVLNYFALEMAAIIVARRHQGAHGRKMRIFLMRIILNARRTHFIICISFATQCYFFFYLFQELKDDLEPSTRSHAIPGLSKLLANLHFLTSVFFFISLFFICVYANRLIYPIHYV